MNPRVGQHPEPGNTDPERSRLRMRGTRRLATRTVAWPFAGEAGAGWGAGWKQWRDQVGGTGLFQSGDSADFSSKTELAAVKGPSWFQSEEGASLSEETGLAPVRVRGWFRSGEGAGFSQGDRDRPTLGCGGE